MYNISIYTPKGALTVLIEVAMINEKMRELGARRSVIRELFEYGKRRRSELGDDAVFDFSLGNPSVPPPPELNEGLGELLAEEGAADVHAYTSAQGDREVRRAIADYVRQTEWAEADPELIYLTAGAAAALTATLTALVMPNEEVIVPTPYFPEYRVFIERTGATVREVPCREPDFSLDVPAIMENIGERTAAIIINSPNNPTGAVYSEENVAALAAALKRRERELGKTIYLIADEPYRELVYDGIKVPYLPNYYDDTVVCYSFSKSLSIPGERIGYALVSPKMRDATAVYQALAGAGRALGFVCAPSLFQRLLPKCLGKVADLGVYEENMRLLYDGLTALGYEAARPAGAFYLFVKALEADATAFSERAKRRGLLLVPSDDFGIAGYVRIAFCVKGEMIARALPAFAALAAEYENSTANGEEDDAT